MEKILSEKDSVWNHIVYSGDGANDFCAVKKLRKQDYVFPRVSYQLEKMIVAKKKSTVKATHLYWDGPKDLNGNFKSVFNL